MYRITPYRRRNLNTRDVFSLFDDFFNESRHTYVRDFRLDVKEEKEKYVVEAELPGLEKKDISIKFENDYLNISIQTEDNEEDMNESDNYLHRERHMFRSERKVFSQDVDPKKLNAKLKNGILTIELMKMEEKISSYMIDIK
jgi:HSP20 family protein